MTISWLPLPAAPTDDGVSTVLAHAGNPLLDWLNLTDSNGGTIALYRLMLEPSYNWLHRTIYSGGAEMCYSLFLVLAAYGAAGLELILTPDRWLGPLTDFYSNLTAAIYQKAPPLAILAITFGFLILSVFIRREGAAPPNGPGGRAPNAPPPGLLEQWMPSNAQISKAQWNRLGSGLVLMAIVIVLAYNPLKMIQEVVNAVVAVASELTFTGNQGGAATYAASGITDILRDTTFFINYRDLLEPACAQQWAQAINLGAGNPQCLTQAQYAATDPDIWTLFMAVLALPIAWGIAKFLWVAGKALLTHLSLTVAYLVAATWIAAGTLARRRPYDPLANVTAKFATHGLLSIGIIFVTAAFPALFVKLFTDVLSFLPTLLQIPLVSLAFYVSARVLTALLQNKGSLQDLFGDRVKKAQTWTNLFNAKADQKTVTTQMLGPVGAQLATPWGWATDRYTQTQHGIQQRWAQLRDGTGAPAAQEGSMMNVPVLPDTPETIGAQRRVELNPDTPADHPELDPTDTEPDTTYGTEDFPTASPHPAAAPPLLALIAPDGTVIAAQAANPATPPGAPGYAWLRGGIPQSVPTTAMAPLPTPIATPIPAPGQPPLTVPHPPAPPSPGSSFDDLVARAGFFQRRAAALRDEASSMRPSTPADADLLDAAARTYRGPALFGDPPAPLPAGSTPPAPTSATPAHRLDFKALLSSAQWTQNLERARNLMAARGITSAPRLAEAALTTERIVFASDAQGHVAVRRKNDRGFGDSI